ncbi:hypothetical protein M404DRAFT_993553 [Pisolithus tinctorius Marx 270]|uniref:Uncharacterized protein n=1 Tax=Pisolithus tinctorius Marx 270 TaxID=870435 RepID=A0A0C3PTL7_PISTI|nr:hypothetical protein M404DRAFT_993553 [Pisolithus tinctorius Marx 270]
MDITRVVIIVHPTRWITSSSLAVRHLHAVFAQMRLNLMLTARYKCDDGYCKHS